MAMKTFNDFNMNDMKKYCYLAVLIFLILGCKRDALKEDPRNVLSPDVLFGTTEGLEYATTNIITQFSEMYANSQCVGIMEMGDDLTAHPASNKQDFREIDRFAVSDANARIQGVWTEMYQCIQASNLLLSKYQLSPASQDVKDRCVGTAHFFRALAYSNLTRSWGKVPLVDSFSTNINYNTPKAEVAEVYKLIVSDLQKAEELLPETPNTNEYPGLKPFKGTARAFLAQVYLTMAGWPLNQTDHYALSAAKAKEVIDNAGSYGYEILPEITDLWTWANNYTNKEIVLGLYYNKTVASNGNMAAPLPSQPEDEGGWFDYWAELSFFNRFPAGKRKDATFQTMIQIDATTHDSVPWHDSKTLARHPFFKKYQDDVDRHDWWGSRTQQIMRYAEVLLNYAEAKAMSDGPDASAYDAVNTIRRRAGDPDLVSGLSAVAFRDSVIAERGWEFAGGEPPSRFYDLIRTETLEQETAKRDPTDLPLQHQPTHADYWLPVPITDVSLNPALK